MGKALQIRQKAADSPQGLTARRWPALLALARKAAGPYGEDVAAWLAVPEAQAEPCLLELAQCLSRLTMRNVDDLAPLTLDSLRSLCDLTRHCEDALGSWQAEDAAAGLQALAALLDTLAARLGDDRAVHFHAHFSRIAYTKGGEKCHLTFADTAFGPPHAPLLALLKERHLAPTIICESAGTQAEDAAALVQGYAAL